MWQRSPICGPQPSRMHPRSSVPVRPVLIMVVFVLVLAASPLMAGRDTPMTRNNFAASASADRREADPARRDQACFPSSVDVWTTGFEGSDSEGSDSEGSDSYVTGWASIDRTAHFEGRSCQVRGWASISPCGRTIAAYLANCPDGAFTFTRTEADCYEVLGCGKR